MLSAAVVIGTLRMKSQFFMIIPFDKYTAYGQFFMLYTLTNDLVRKHYKYNYQACRNAYSQMVLLRVPGPVGTHH